MGVSSVPGHYNRRMTEALGDLPGLARVVDDTLIHGKTDEDHMRNVVAYLDRCREQHIRLNGNIFIFKQKEIEIASMLLSRHGFTIHPNIVQAIRELCPVPQSITGMRRFCGFANQLAPYDDKLAQKLAPLRHLLKKTTTKFQMTEDEIRDFKEAREILFKPGTLAFYTLGQKVQLFTDAACTKGYGYILQQLQRDGQWKPIMYGSRSRTDAETRYAAIEAEITAMTWALKKARKFFWEPPNSLSTRTTDLS